MSRFLIALLFFFSSVSCNALRLGQSHSKSGNLPQNVIFFIADGCGPASFGLAREFQKATGGEASLFLDAFNKGSVATFTSNHKITDSAASATAYSCAIKTYNGAIGMDVNKQPVENVLEAAEKAGYQTALISTARITHATPASFSSHVVNRNMESEIGSQQIGQGIEILMGGGRSFYLPVDKGGLRIDSRNLMVEAEKLGYKLVSTKNEMMASTELPLLALFTPSHMAYEIDRNQLNEPSLAEMTVKALALLSNSKKPFFIMIEGGRIDHAGHANDTAAHIHDILAYDDAVRAAIEFAKKDKKTLVMATSDHETGGLTLGAQWGPFSGYTYDPKRLQNVSSSIEKFMSDMAFTKTATDMDASNWIEQQSDKRFGLRSEPFQTAVKKISQYRKVTGDSTAYSHLRIMLVDSTARMARAGWSTSNHTSVDVPIFAFGPGADLFSGTMDNTAVGWSVFRALGLR
ncbi:MAG: alkaline phosphatase [Bacteroidetes bacterium]|nr:alkaline phosphatase [Bacteroidota bacterium]